MEFKQRSPKKKSQLNLGSKLEQPKLDHYDKDVASDWFAEDSDWVDLYESTKKNHSKESIKKRQIKNQVANNTSQVTPQSVEVNIKLSMPKISKDIFARYIEYLRAAISNFYTYNKQKILLFGFFVCIFVISFFIYTVFIKPKTSIKDAEAKSSANAQTVDAGGVQKLPIEKPKFKILYPASKNSDSIGQIVRVSPASNSPAYAYSDVIGGIKVNISQQEIPDALKTEKARDDLAGQNSQKDIVHTDDHTKVYIGKSSKGVQSVTFVKGNLLIFIKSENIISNDLWKSYIEAMHS